MPYNRPIPQKGKSPLTPPTGKPLSALATLVEAERMMQIAFILPSAAFIGWLGGSWVGGKLHMPWLTVFGILFGGASGLVYVIRLVISAGSKTASRAAKERARKEISPNKP